MSDLLKEICLLRGANSEVNGSWIEALANTFNVTDSKGSWYKSIIDKQRETITPPNLNMSFWQELCYGEGITDDIGSWILSYYIVNNGCLEPYWLSGYTEDDYISCLEPYWISGYIDDNYVIYS